MLSTRFPLAAPLPQPSNPPQADRVFRLFGVNVIVPHQEEEVHAAWQYTKVLKKSDIDGSSRFLISRSFVREHVMPNLQNYQREILGDIGGGIRVDVLDADYGSTHQLTLRRWQSNSFVLISNWTRDFVNRRRLAINNTIGLSWDSRTSRLVFSVLNR
ncbi:hypothetical protein Leryth_018297 [Lithospermum erythrorhizon]|nr:hypothetical protein Leryth_018297 [Lithospermum erythrorhizon]